MKNNLNFIGKILVLFLSSLLLPIHGYASQWSRNFEVSYPLGAGETMVTARQVAREQIKQKAIDAAGTYIQTTAELKDNTLTEQIKMVSGAIVKL